MRLSNFKLIVMDNAHNISSANTMTDFATSTTLDPDSMYSLVTGPYVAFTILGAIISSTLLILIFSYLNNVSLVKECVLVYLYKDVVIIFILMNCVRVIWIIVWYSNNSGFGIEATQAKVISLGHYFLVILLLLLINILNAVKCYILKSKVLDPPMPWRDEDILGINIIRLAYSIFTTGFISVMYALGLYPKLYYALVEPNLVERDWGEGNYIFPGLVMFLCSTGVITAIVAKIHEEVNEKILEGIIPQQINYSFGIIHCIIIVLVTSTIFLVEVFEVVTLTHLWQIFCLLAPLILTIIPAIVIYRVHQVQSYALRVIKEKLEEAFFLNIYLTPSIITLIMYSTLYILYQLFDI